MRTPPGPWAPTSKVSDPGRMSAETWARDHRVPGEHHRPLGQTGVFLCVQHARGWMEPGAGDLLVRALVSGGLSMAPQVLLGNMGLREGLSIPARYEACSGGRGRNCSCPGTTARLPTGATRIGDFALQSDAMRGHS